MPSSRGSSPSTDQTHIPALAGRFLTTKQAIREAHSYTVCVCVRVCVCVCSFSAKLALFYIIFLHSYGDSSQFAITIRAKTHE